MNPAPPVTRIFMDVCLSFECLDIQTVWCVDVKFGAVEVGSFAFAETAAMYVGETGFAEELFHFRMIVTPFVRTDKPTAETGDGAGGGNVFWMSPEQAAGFLRGAFTLAGMVGVANEGKVGNGNAQATTGDEDTVTFSKDAQGFPSFHVFEDLGTIDEIHGCIGKRQSFADVYESNDRPCYIVGGRQDTETD